MKQKILIIDYDLSIKNSDYAVQIQSKINKGYNLKKRNNVIYLVPKKMKLQDFEAEIIKGSIDELIYINKQSKYE